MAQSRHICCCGADSWTRVIAWFQIITSIIGAIFLFAALVYIGVNGEMKLKEILHHEASLSIRHLSFEMVIASLTIFIGLVIVSLIMAIVLLKGVNEKKINYITAWIVYTVIGVGGQIIIKVLTLNSPNLIEGSISITLTLLINSFLIWVVWTFRREVQMSKFDEKDGGIPYKI